HSTGDPPARAIFMLDQVYLAPRVDERLKQTVKFQKHNLLTDPFPRNMDLIVCRNVLIYFTEEAKRMLYRKFHDALRPGGVLFVGSTEQIFNPSLYGFEVEETFFYRRK
ncbi:CheR family methyltransferase, partial [Geobacillus stearothermophilus]|nr:CheR family methyltransferase [Geobacillus stearothermophilus]